MTKFIFLIDHNIAIVYFFYFSPIILIFCLWCYILSYLFSFIFWSLILFQLGLICSSCEFILCIISIIKFLIIKEVLYFLKNMLELFGQLPVLLLSFYCLYILFKYIEILTLFICEICYVQPFEMYFVILFIYFCSLSFMWGFLLC